MSRPRAVILDVDGTLIDSNDAHAHAWVESCAEFGHPVAFEKVRRLIGMGGDKVLPELTGISEEDEIGQQMKKRRGEIFRERYLPRLKAFPEARALLERFTRDGLTLAVATSASRKDMRALLEQAGIADLIDEHTSADDADESKPDPDIVHAALKRAGVAAGEAVMLGDTPYLAGDHPTLADGVLIGVARWLDYHAVAPASRWPRIPARCCWSIRSRRSRRCWTWSRPCR